MSPVDKSSVAGVLVMRCGRQTEELGNTKAEIRRIAEELSHFGKQVEPCIGKRLHLGVRE